LVGGNVSQWQYQHFKYKLPRPLPLFSGLKSPLPLLAKIAELTGVVKFLGKSPQKEHSTVSYAVNHYVGKKKAIDTLVEPALVGLIVGVTACGLGGGTRSISLAGFNMSIAVPFTASVFGASLVAESIKQSINETAESKAILAAVKHAVNFVSSGLSYVLLPVNSYVDALKFGGIGGGAEIAGNYAYSNGSVHLSLK